MPNLPPIAAVIVLTLGAYLALVSARDKLRKDAADDGGEAERAVEWGEG